MRAVIYARYSTDNQREESIEGQIREYKEYAEHNNMVVVKSYIDRALSAKTDNRPEFRQMIKDSASGNFDVVLVWKLDRFARNRYDSAHYKATLRKNGVRVISAKEAISDGPEGIILESMLEGYAEYYSAELSQKVTRGLTENALKARYNGGTLPMGYMIDKDKHYQINPETAPIVKEILTRYAEGENSKSILNSLIAKGIKNQRGTNLTYSFIQNMLKNRRYLGEYRFKDTVVENAFTSLITQELFDKCQRRLVANKRNASHFKPVASTYLLTGKIFCGKCGSTMAGVSGTSHTGVIHRYYQCRAAKIKKTCDKKRINKDLIEDIVLDYITAMLNDRPLIDRIAETCCNLQKNANTKLPAMKDRMKQIDKELDNVLKAIKSGIFTATVKNELDKLEKEKSDLELAIAQEQIERPTLTKEQIKRWLCKFKIIDRKSDTAKQRAIEIFVNSLYVYDDKILIMMNYKDGEICVDYEEIKKYMQKKENSDSQKDYQSSPIIVLGDTSHLIYKIHQAPYYS